ncbi:ankyrin repeat protein [Ancylostoma caninum]|uniref:Ankyrin repeat protein n=1 Tax=Ancylostoma caninum TaxID=29170 RepID=A0A368F8B6_ANCCA|nr:ankyrin repeat protein [Ancylostoma caninum]
MIHRADAFCMDKLGKTPFDLACEFGKERMVDYMLRSVENLALLQNSGEAHKASALHLAARNGHTHIVCRLLEHGWDVNRTTALGSALHEAAGYGRAQVVRFLLHAGINASLTNAAGLTALEYAKKNAHRNPITIKEIRFLLKGSSDPFGNYTLTWPLSLTTGLVYQAGFRALGQTPYNLFPPAANDN